MIGLHMIAEHLFVCFYGERFISNCDMLCCCALNGMKGLWGRDYVLL